MNIYIHIYKCIHIFVDDGAIGRQLQEIAMWNGKEIFERNKKQR